MAKKNDTINRIVCDCGHETSGPDAKAVAATHQRHLKAKHKK